MAKVEPHIIHGTDVGLRAKLAESAFPQPAESVSAWQPRQGVPPGALVLLASATHSCPHSHVGAAPVFSPRSTKNVRPLKTSTRVSLTKIDGVKRMPGTDSYRPACAGSGNRWVCKNGLVVSGRCNVLA